MKKKFKVIAGPCVIESKEMAIESAGILKSLADEMNFDFYFKASFDKANRSNMNSFRGPGITDGLNILKAVKEKYGVKITTDIHEAGQAEIVAKICDMIQIPAFLCRQTDLLLAAAKTEKEINIKKGQFLAPWDMKNLIQKVEACGNHKILLCERGTSFGYNRLVVDMTGIAEMKKFGYPVVFDATHSVQLPGGLGESTGGNREYVPCLAKAAIAAGADAVFLEVHKNPEQALSDGPNMMYLSDIKQLLKELMDIYEMIGEK